MNSKKQNVNEMVLTFQALVLLTVSGWALSDHFDEGFHHEHKNIFHTPNREHCPNHGKCLPLNDCPHLRKRAEEGDNKELASMIKDFGCGFHTVIHVCCAEKNIKPPREYPLFMHHLAHPGQLDLLPFDIDEISRPVHEHDFEEPHWAEESHSHKEVPNWHDPHEGSTGFVGQGNFGQNFQSGKPNQGGLFSDNWNQGSHSTIETSNHGFGGSSRPSNPDFHGGYSTSSTNSERPSNFGSGSSYNQGISGGDRPLNQGFGVSGSAIKPVYEGIGNERPGQSVLGNQGPQQFVSSINERPFQGGFDTNRPSIQSFGSERPSQGGFDTNRPSIQSFGSERPSQGGFHTNRPGIQSFGSERPGNSGLNRPNNYDTDYSQPSTNTNRPSNNRPGSNRPASQGNYNEQDSYGSSSFTNGGTNSQRPNNEGSKKRPSNSGSNKRKPNRRLLPDDKCGTEISDKIIGGEETSLDEFPWMALLHFTTRSGQDRGYGCGGSLINERYVLTAAHCIKGPSLPRNTIVDTVRLGEYDITKQKDCVNGVCSPPPIDAAVEEIIVHPEYKPTDKAQYHDIALIRLRKKVPFSTYISPICVPGDELKSKDYSGKQLVVAGWGKTANGEQGKSSSVKQKVSLPFVTLENCKPFYNGININLRNTQMCAGGEKAKDSCQGDSGGPLMSNEMVNGQSSWFVNGIVSFGPEDCGVKNIAGVYTKVSQYVDWILENIKE